MTLAATVAVSGTGPLLLTGVVTLDEAAHFISREIIGLLFGMFRSIAALTAAGFFAHLALYPRAGYPAGVFHPDRPGADGGGAGMLDRAPSDHAGLSTVPAAARSTIQIARPGSGLPSGIRHDDNSPTGGRDGQDVERYHQ